MKSHQDRVVFLDFLRIIACFFVIVNHTNSSVFMNREPSVTWFVSVSYFFISKPAVTLFIMISGVVLLSREETIGALLKRVLRVVVVLLVFSLLYTVDASGVAGLPGFLGTVISRPVTTAFWYLYLYIGLLLMTPLVRKMIKTMDKAHYFYLFGLSLLFVGLYPIVNHYFPGFSISYYTFLPFFSAYIGMFVLGYYLHTHVAPSGTIACLAACLYVLSLAVQVVCTYFEYLKNNNAYLFFDNRTLITITIPSVCLFYLCKYIFERVNKAVYNMITRWGKCTFGIFLLADLLIDKLSFLRTLFESVLHPLCAVFLFQCVIFGTGLVLTYLLRKIPMIAKYI